MYQESGAACQNISAAFDQRCSSSQVEAVQYLSLFYYLVLTN